MKSMITRNLIAITGAALLAAGSAQGDIVLADDFNDGVIDTAKWEVLDANSVVITEAAGVISGTRTSASDVGYITSVGSWNPANGAITISGRFTATSDAAIALWTRSTGEYDSDALPFGAGLMGSGNRMSWFIGAASGSGFGAFEKEDAVWPWTNIAGSGTIDAANLTRGAGVWDFVMTDDGSALSLTVTSVSNPANTGSIAVNSTFVPAVTSNRIAFALNPGVQLDYITVDVVPEPGSLALLGLGGMLLARRRRAQ